LKRSIHTLTDHIRSARDGHVLNITLARPEKKNALTSAMYEALIVLLHEADADATIRAVAIEGSGRSFCAGNDIGDFLSGARDMLNAPAFRFIKALAACDTPLVAAVEGAAVGVGTTLLLHCDLAYAAPDAKFRMPFVNLGLVPEAAASLLVPQLAGVKKATEWLMLGDGFDARDAERFGVINAVVETGVSAHARAQAQRLAAKPPAALAATRKLMRGGRAAILARIDAEGAAFGAALASPEARAAFTSFMEKGKAKA
jgi:enoyl-CoA hydratase/carnithine racemase